MVHIDEKKLQQAFLEEVQELLEALNKQLLELEKSKKDPDIINEIFRLTHSIKSEAALVGFLNISKIAHKMEDIFEKLRKGSLQVDVKIMDALFSAFDRIMDLVAAVQNGEDESQFQILDVLNPLLGILGEKKQSKAAAKKISQTKKKQPQAAAPQEADGSLKVSLIELEDLKENLFNEIERNQIEETMGNGELFYQVTYYLAPDCDMRYPRAYLVYNNLINISTVIKTLPDIHGETEDEQFQKVTVFLLTQANTDRIKECADVDQVDKIEIAAINTGLLKEKLNLDLLVEGEETLYTDEEVKKAEQIEREWNQKIEQEYNKDKITEQVLQKMENDDDESTEDNIAEKTAQGPTKVKKNISNMRKNIQKQTIRVDIDRLDNLLNLVGELIINRSRFLELKDHTIEEVTITELKAELEDATNELERITDQMQMGMMQARMVPIGNVFSKFPRMVRDLANALHKSVHLEIIGEHTEIDRTVIELIAEPLTHLIRNSIDHGVESPEQRENSGKKREGKVTLRAYQEGSYIYIEVYDDGEGMDIEKIKKKALDKGLVSKQNVNSLSQSELLNYIFEPGFSTKHEITNISGRGVGMDVVKTQIEKLRGRISITTKLGEGTKFTIILPLTTTIVEALLVSVQKNIFAIPISVVEETIKVTQEDIKVFDDYQVYNLRNETLAILYLADLVGLKKDENQENIFIVVVSFDGRKVGLVVNDLLGEQDIVIKALDEVLKNNEGIAGAAVLGGTGKIALILDTNTLVKSSIKEINKLAKLHEMWKDTDNMGQELRQFYDHINQNIQNQENETKNSHILSKLKNKTIPDPDEKTAQKEVKTEQKSNQDDDDKLKKIEKIMQDIKSEI